MVAIAAAAVTTAVAVRPSGLRSVLSLALVVSAMAPVSTASGGMSRATLDCTTNEAGAGDGEGEAWGGG